MPNPSTIAERDVRMKRSISTLAIAAFALAGAPALATPDDKPVNAAEVRDDAFGVGCYVRASDTDPYVYDSTCESHTVIKRNKDGTLRTIIYRDNSVLLAGQTAPDHAAQFSLSQTVYGLPCTGIEVVTPSGEYMSNLRCGF